MPTANVSALTEQEKEELRIRLEARQQYEEASVEERRRIEERARLEADFSAFVKAGWSVIRPGLTLDWSWHYDLIGEYLTLCHQRKIRRLIINISPRTLKSILVSVFFPVWVWTKQPEHGFATASYSQDLSTEHSVMRRNLIESDWFKQRWGDRIWLASDQNQKTKFKNNHQAQMIATSVGGTATGLGGNTLIVDDALNPKQAASEAERKTAHDWFDNTWRSRMNNPAEDALIVMEQRTGELDLTGHLIDADDILEAQGASREWTHLSIALECDAETGPQRYLFPISGRVVEREVGDVLQPGRFPPAVVASLKILRLVWATQYQQRPSPLEGNLIKRSEVRYYGGREPVTGMKDRPLPDKFDTIIVSADCSFKDENRSDFVAIGTISVKGPDRYLLELTNTHLDEPATRTEILRQKNKWRANTVIVEDKANGSSVIKNLRRHISGVIAIEPEGGKFARMFVAAGAWQSGNWYVDRTAAITEPFIDQLIKFPAAKNDDMADMMSQAEIFIASRGYKFAVVASVKRAEEDMKKRQEQRYKQPNPKTLAEAIENVDTIEPVGEVEGVEVEGTQKIDQPRMSKPVVADNTPRCDKCGSTLIQRVPGGKRCGNCGVQWMAANLIEKPMLGQLRK